jgi:hypothetical protein
MTVKSQLTQLLVEEMADSNQTFEKVYKAVWKNPRIKKVGGMRLTDDGLSLLTETLSLKSHKIDFSKNVTFTNQLLNWMDNFIEGPYHVTEKSITLFMERDTIQLILFEGDIQKLSAAKAEFKLNENSTEEE